MVSINNVISHESSKEYSDTLILLISDVIMQINKMHDISQLMAASMLKRKCISKP